MRYLTLSGLQAGYIQIGQSLHEAIARKAGRSGTDHKYLGLIIQNGAMTAGELSKLTGLTTGAVTGVIGSYPLSPKYTL
jgi:hypothetical protein